MYNKVFLDANVILDIFDFSRSDAQDSFDVYTHLLLNKSILYTSCDIITTLFYIHSKKSKTDALQKIEKINKIITVIDFSNQEVANTCLLMHQNPNFKDLEDTIQYILAKKMTCDLILTNDQRFYSEDIPVMSSKAFAESMV